MRVSTRLRVELVRDADAPDSVADFISCQRPVEYDGNRITHESRKMKNRSHALLVSLFCLILLLPGFAQEAEKKAEKKSKVKVSAFAPLKETEAQLKYFIEKIGKDLSDKEEFGEAEGKRIGLDASTVSVLALTLGMHDQKSKLQPVALQLIELSGAVAENAEDFDKAKKAHDALLAALTKPAKPEKKPKPLELDEPVADLAMLMQQVPIVNAGLRKGVDDKRRFARNAQKRTAPKAVTLAAIANASMMDTNYCGDEEDEKAWKAICADMRDACADVYKALMKKDQAAAKKANQRVVETCDACHDKFR